MAKSKYQDVKEKLILVEGWARDGLTDKQIAHNLGIAMSTLQEYKNKHKEFSETLKRGKEVVDREVEGALYKSAVGYRYTEQVVTNKGDIVNVERFEKPNTTAMIFWLKNRKPQEWRDKQDIEHSGDVGVKIIDDID